MSDDPILAALTRLEAGQSEMSGLLARLETSVSRVESEQTRLRTDMNNKLEQVLDAVTVQRGDLHNAKAFLFEDAIVTGRRMMSIEDRLARLERKLPDAS